MKKNDWLMITGVLIYSYLFYEQFAGINFLVFTLILLGSLWIKDSRFLLHKRTRFPIVGALSSAICIAIYGSGLAVFANICSLGFLSVRFINPDSSLFSSLFHSAYSGISSPVYLCINAIRKLRSTEEQYMRSRGKGLLFYLVPLVVFLLFFLFYRGSSSLFRNLTDQIQFDFISLEWIFFTIGGLILLNAFYKSRQLKMLSTFEALQKDDISQSGISTFYIMGYPVSMATEQKSGVMMFTLLNLLILVVNLLDIQFLFLGSELPTGMNYSQLVHQGIDSLIMSIIAAIIIIIWYFKGELNFTKKKTLKILAFVWIVQNVIMIGSNIYKNALYIDEYSLTYKRIGVYVYLCLAIIGLITTAIKILKIKSNWYLLKANVMAAYVVLLVCCLINWDLWIVRFNIQQSDKYGKELDVEYVACLSPSVIPDLSEWMLRHKGTFPLYFKERIAERAIETINEQVLVDWRSWSMERDRITEEIDRLLPQLTVIQQ